jgi:nucleoside-diphosphate-sugar epimerase
VTQTSKPNSQTTVLVTGISGFLAGHIAVQLLQQGYRVRGTVRTVAKRGSVEASLRRGGAEDVEGVECVEADLLQDKGWDEAVSGCDYVIHTASPFPASVPKDENELIRPAREGTLRVLRAAHRAGVQRVVLTSSIAATNYGSGVSPYSEKDWTDVNGPQATPYYKSKTLAEQDAWAFARESGLALAVINPGLILGPLLNAEAGTSLAVLHKLLRGDFPALPRFGMCVVDVRDVADAHLRAMRVPDAAGQRFIAAGRFMWLSEIAAELHRAFPQLAGKVPQRTLPNWLVKVFALFDPATGLIVRELGLEKAVDTSKARSVLGWSPRSEEEAIRAGVQSLVDMGLLKPAV